MMGSSKIAALVAGLMVLLIGYMSIFTVTERELAIKFRLGEFERADYKPGVYPMWPFINRVQKFDRRILTLDAEPAQFLTLEKKNVIVDTFVKWRISSVELYYKTVSGDERIADDRLSKVINAGLRGEFGKRTIQEAISGERSEIMKVISAQIEEQVKQFGIEVVDVRIKRIELPAEVSTSVYRRMEAERARVAKDLRSRGAEAAERIRADADRQSIVIQAEANRKAEQLRGEGDAQAAQIYARAYGKDERFYQFYRSLNAYRNVFSKKDDVLVLDPQSEFFKYFRTPAGR